MSLFTDRFFRQVIGHRLTYGRRWLEIQHVNLALKRVVVRLVPGHSTRILRACSTSGQRCDDYRNCGQTRELFSNDIFKDQQRQPCGTQSLSGLESHVRVVKDKGIFVVKVIVQAAFFNPHQASKIHHLELLLFFLAKFFQSSLSDHLLRLLHREHAFFYTIFHNETIHLNRALLPKTVNLHVRTASVRLLYFVKSYRTYAISGLIFNSSIEPRVNKKAEVSTG